MDIQKVAGLGDTDELVLTGADVKALTATIEAQAKEKAAVDAARGEAIVKVGTDREAPARKAKGVGLYLKALVDREYVEAEKISRDYANDIGSVTKANFNETTDAQGGFLAPSVWVDDIFATVEKAGYARRLAKIYPMTAKTHKLNRGGSVTAAMVAEESAPTPIDSASFFSQTTLTAKRAAAAFLTSRELLADATPAYYAYMTGELGRAIAALEDAQFFKGAGTGAEHTGLIGTSGVNTQYFGGASNSGKDTISEVSWKDLTRVLVSQNGTTLSNGTFVIPQTVFAYLMQETDGVSGRPIWNAQQPVDAAKYVGMEALAGNVFWTPIGRPAVIVPDALFPTTAVTTTHIIFGDFSKAFFGPREEAEVQTFRESYNGTALSGVNRIAVEVSERFGIAFPAPAEFTLIKTSTT
jgi:HK97 family phage major capsid protein